MKIINRYALLLISFMGLCLSLSSCQEEDLPNAGEPRILYVRVTNPTQADSLLGGALLNNLVAIMGENLQNTTEVWFNDQKAILNPTYVTNRSILVNVPANSPEVVTDLLTLVFRNQGKDTGKHPGDHHRPHWDSFWALPIWRHCLYRGWLREGNTQYPGACKFWAAGDIRAQVREVRGGP